MSRLPSKIHDDRTLILSDSGKPLKLLANAAGVLRSHPKTGGIVRYNEFNLTVELCERPPWDCTGGEWVPRPWTDNDDRLFTIWLQWNEVEVTDAVAAQAVEVIARETPFHPVCTYIRNAKSDGVPRIDTWMSTLLGVPDTPYSRAVGKRWLLSGVARVMQPGCKVDTCLVLEGKQGAGKSQALRTLAPLWFTDRISDIGSKDAMQELAGVWIVELAELDATRRSHRNTTKAFLSSNVDRYRPPYGRRPIDVPRQCIFAATVNPEGGYLKDPTGGRRFWPVRCGRIDLRGLAEVTEALWAESYAAYQNGDPWWLETSELVALAAAEQAARYQGDVWENHILRLTEGKTTTSVDEVLEGLGLDRTRWTPGDQNRVAKHLLSHGWERYRANTRGLRPWRYRRLTDVA